MEPHVADRPLPAVYLGRGGGADLGVGDDLAQFILIERNAYQDGVSILAAYFGATVNLFNPTL